MAQGLKQPRSADWTSLHPSVAAAELREDQVSGLDGRTRLERDTPGPDACAQLTPVGGVAENRVDGCRLDTVGENTVCLCVVLSEKVAELSYVATLEDLGLIKAREVIVSDSSYVRF